MTDFYKTLNHYDEHSDPKLISDETMKTLDWGNWITQ